MKTVPSRSSRGFTLMELLVVITLIAILAGMVLAAMPGILNQIKRKQIKAFIAEIESGLDSYRIDNGLYPMNPEGKGQGPIDDQTAVEGSVVLYKNLSGDFDMDDQGIVDDDMTPYVERLDNWSNREHPTRKKPPVERSVQFQIGYAVVDPMGSPLRYVAEAPGIAPALKRTRNPTYDLWSVAGAEADSTDFSDQSKWITNWGN